MFQRCLPYETVKSNTSELLSYAKFRLASVWRADSFRASEGLPMTMRRALALNAVLKNCALPVFLGELLHCATFMTCGPDVDEARVAQDNVYLASLAGRDFWSSSDHDAPDYKSVLAKGLNGLKADVETALQAHSEPDKLEFLQSCLTALDGASMHINRYAQAVQDAADAGGEYAELLQTQAQMLRHIATEPPRDFWEALQLVLLLHTIYQLDDRYAMAFGRLDQYLYPYYIRDIAAKKLTSQQAQMLFDHFFARVASDGDVQNIAIGGVTRNGENAVNELSFLILEACKRIGKAGGNVTARISEKSPDEFVVKCAEVIRTGIGYPAVFNDELEIEGLVARGFPLEDAREYCFVGCIEVHIQGKQAPWADSRFNTPRCVELALRNGFDKILNIQAGPETGEPQSWEEFYEAFRAQLYYGIHQHCTSILEYLNRFESQPENYTAPLLSAMTQDCISRGLDICDGGAVYALDFGVAVMGIGSTADTLMAIKQAVFEDKKFSLDELRAILDLNFEGYEAERQYLLKAIPKYGNANDAVDNIAAIVAKDAGKRVMEYYTPRGGQFVGLLGANISNIYAGQEIGATADGRHALQPLSDAASPGFGRDIMGPTASIQSISRIDYRDYPAGNVVNMKLHPTAIAGDEGLQKLAMLIRTCFKLGGIQLQFNTTDSAVLRKAIETPEEYRNLTVRVSGFSATYVHLAKEVQHDILSRTEHKAI